MPHLFPDVFLAWFGMDLYVSVTIKVGPNTSKLPLDSTLKELVGIVKSGGAS